MTGRDDTSLAGTLPAVVLASGAALAIQVTLTRVFSITLWHHFTYLILSMALLGYGTAGALLTRRGAALAAEPIDTALVLPLA